MTSLARAEEVEEEPEEEAGAAEGGVPGLPFAAEALFDRVPMVEAMEGCKFCLLFDF